jgi:hypothetical protein
MDDLRFEVEIMNHLRTVSGLEEKRGYVGISNIGKCPRRAYLDLTQGQRMSDDGHRMCYAGYLFERDALARLAAAELARPTSSWEVIAPWDARVRGHTDANTSWGDLLEIKSVTKFKFDMLLEKSRPLHEHIDQVQLYMRYGSWRRAWILYVCRETFEHRVFEVRYDDRLAEKLEEKLKALVRAVDEKKAPMCECRRCK